MCFSDRHASATNLTVPPESTCLQIKEHKRRCPQQQHLWACGGTSRYETKWSTCGRGNGFARIFTQFDWCSFWTRSCVSFTMLFLGMQIDCKRWQKTEKHGSQQIHNVVLNWAGHAYRRQQQQQQKTEFGGFLIGGVIPRKLQYLTLKPRNNTMQMMQKNNSQLCRWQRSSPRLRPRSAQRCAYMLYVLMDQDLL